MEVYLVLNDEGHVRAVFSTIEKANEYLQKLEAQWWVGPGNHVQPISLDFEFGLSETKRD